MNETIRRLIPESLTRNRILRKLRPALLERPALRKIWAYIDKVGGGPVLWVLDTLEGGHGHALSFLEQKPVDKSNSPIPWYSYPAIEYLSGLDFRDKTFFEYGSGNSSLFWASRCRKIVSVENNEDWYALVSQNCKPNQTICLRPDKDDYVGMCLESSAKYDVIIVDGSHRFACAQQATTCLAPGGLIILDNSDWHPKTASLLREAGLIQVDFTGFNPINYYVTTTSLFLHRDIQITPRFERLPMPGIGAGMHIEDPE